jgi:hypothetical protein
MVVRDYSAALNVKCLLDPERKDDHSSWIAYAIRLVVGQRHSRHGVLTHRKRTANALFLFKAYRWQTSNVISFMVYHSTVLVKGVQVYVSASCDLLYRGSNLRMERSGQLPKGLHKIKKYTFYWDTYAADLTHATGCKHPRLRYLCIYRPFLKHFTGCYKCTPPLWCSDQSSWLQIPSPGLDSWRYQIFF